MAMSRAQPQMINATASGTPTQFGPGAIAIGGGGVTGMGLGTWPMGGFPGATTMDAGPLSLDQVGQIHINYQRMTVKSDSVANLGAGVGRHHLFFIHRPRTQQLLHPQAMQQYVTCSLPDLNKLLFNDACEQRNGGKSRYHNPDTEVPIFTAKDIMCEWNMQGVCVATEGVDSVHRAMMNKMMITETVGGWVKCLNYWGTLETDAILWLLVKMVKIETDTHGNTVNGHYTDMSYEAVRRAAGAHKRILTDPRVVPLGAGAVRHPASMHIDPALLADGVPEYGVAAGPEARRRRIELGAVPATVGDPWCAWQIVPRWYKTTRGDDTIGPTADEISGELPAPFGADPSQKMRWYGDAIRVGRTGFVHHRGASPELAAAQKEAAITLTHPFQRAAGLDAASTGIFETTKAEARVMDVDLYLRM